MQHDRDSRLFIFEDYEVEQLGCSKYEPDSEVFDLYGRAVFSYQKNLRAIDNLADDFENKAAQGEMSHLEAVNNKLLKTVDQLKVAGEELEPELFFPKSD